MVRRYASSVVVEAVFQGKKALNWDICLIGQIFLHICHCPTKYKCSTISRTKVMKV